MRELCVVHLVRVHNHIDSFINFIESYKDYAAGIDHDLLIVFKGFSRENVDLDLYKSLLGSIEYKDFYVNDNGLDITAYIKVLSAHEYSTYCFLNSHSQILAECWLSKLYNALQQPDVGLVGATGSYQSMFTDQVADGVVVPSFDDRNFPAWKKVFMRLAYSVYMYWDFFSRWCFFKIKFSTFPNPHIRTNAFMVGKKTIDRMRLPKVKTKMDAWLFESGKKGLTCTIKSMGKKVVVVGRDGKSYDESLWPSSGTYKQGDQTNLLIADNQTKAYQHGDNIIRKQHSKYAWGPKMQP